jgi:hypothetical protein
MMRAYFVLCSALGWLLRSGKYSRVRIVCQNGQRRVRKRRLFYAPLLVWLSGPLVRVLNTGVRVLPQRDWEQRERLINWSLRGSSIRIESGGTLVMPLLAGTTLASLLEDPEVEAPARKRAMAWAVVALADFHRLGFTHGDAMAENVLIDHEARVAHWFDFETVHDPARPVLWQRGDDLRALLATCLVRTAPEHRPEIVEHILNAYQDGAVTRLVAATFSSVYRRPLSFHLAQAGLSFEDFMEIGHLLGVEAASQGACGGVREATPPGGK